MKENNPMALPNVKEKHLIACQSPEHRKRMSESKIGISLPPRTEEHKKHISESKKGVRVSDETKIKISKTLKGRECTWGDKISVANKGNAKTLIHRKNLSKVKSLDWWVQFDKDGEMIINIFENGGEILEKLNINSNNIVDKDNFPTRCAYGFKWKRFKKNEITKEELYSIYGRSI